MLQADPWPGNIRELENVARRLLLAGRGLAIDAESARKTMAARNATAGTAPPGTLAAQVAALLERAERGETVDVHAQVTGLAEREVITQAILLAQGNQAKAARWLGLSRFTLREKLKQLGLHAGPGEGKPGARGAEPEA